VVLLREPNRQSAVSSALNMSMSRDTHIATNGAQRPGRNVPEYSLTCLFRLLLLVCGVCPLLEPRSENVTAACGAEIALYAALGTGGWRPSGGFGKD
jgi:hypothetical protein